MLEWIWNEILLNVVILWNFLMSWKLPLGTSTTWNAIKLLAQVLPFNASSQTDAVSVPSAQNWSLQCPSNGFWGFKKYLYKNCPSKHYLDVMVVLLLEGLGEKCPSSTIHHKYMKSGIYKKQNGVKFKFWDSKSQTARVPIHPSWKCQTVSSPLLTFISSFQLWSAKVETFIFLPSWVLLSWDPTCLSIRAQIYGR